MWVNWLTSQSSSLGTDRGGGRGGSPGDRELLEKHPYRGVFIGCESLEAAEAQTLCEDLAATVFIPRADEE